jgi:ribosome maturation protein SDO1
MKMRRNQPTSISEIIRDTKIWTDLKKGMKAGNDEMMNAFGTNDFSAIVERIVRKGEIEVTQEFRDEEIETRRKQIVDFLIRNAVDARTGRPFTPDIIDSALKQVGARIDKQSVERQIPNLIEKIRTIIPLKIETKKIRIVVPAVHTGRVYGIVQEYKEKEEWLNNGDLELILNIPVGMQTDFYDKLNGITHGSAITQEITEK